MSVPIGFCDDPKTNWLLAVITAQVPIEILLQNPVDVFAQAPIIMLKQPVWLLDPEQIPINVLPNPDVLFKPDIYPIKKLDVPASKADHAQAPIIVLQLDVAFEPADDPIKTLSDVPKFSKPVQDPTNVFLRPELVFTPE